MEASEKEKMLSGELYRDHPNMVRWTTFDHGGHFAAHKAPDLLVGDIQAFFGPLR